MKRSLSTFFAIALSLAMVLSFLPGSIHLASAATTIIAQWTFESPNTPAAATAAIYPNPIPSTIGTGNAGGVHTSASTAWSTPVGNGSSFSFSSNNWSVGNYYQFSTSTTGFTGISVSWDQTGSATGPRDFKLAYSTDGTNFTDFYSYSLPSASWSSGSTSLATKFSSDLSTVTALNSQATVYFRLIDASTTSINAGTVATGGTGRVDNFTLSGTGDPAPYVANTVPANGAADVPVNSSITVNFSEPVNVVDPWYALSCATTGDHTATVTGGPTNFTLDPDTDFVMGEQCTLTIIAANVTDQDLVDPPDDMTINFTAGFSTVAPPMSIGTVNGQVLDSDDGTLHTSPYVGQTVKIQGVIYEKTLQAIANSANTYKGFFMQNTLATADGDPYTSDGIFVFMSTASNISGYTPQVGDEIVLQAKVSEYFNMTELVAPLAVLSVVRSGVDISTELEQTLADPAANLADANRYWERHQGMRITVPQDSIVLGGRGVFSPADAEIWVARPDSTIAQRADPYTRKAFRDAHPLDDNYDAANWDGNGYRILMGSLGIKAAANNAQALIDPARSYSTLTNAPAGGLNYTFSKYRIETDGQPEFAEGVDPSANHAPDVFDRSIHYTVVDYNLENLYDYRDNPFSGCDFAGNGGCPKVAPFTSAVTPPYDYVPASEAAYQARVNDISLEIINDLHSPDILMVQEVENQDICALTDGVLTCGGTDNADGQPDVLQDLALQIAANGGPAYAAAFDRNSSDLRGIAPSYLYRTDRVELLPADGDPLLGTDPMADAAFNYAGATVPANSDISNPKTLNAVLPAGVTACETSWVFPRAMDVALFRIWSNAVNSGSHRDVYVLDNHFKSGPDTCIGHRTEQAKFNAAVIDYLQTVEPEARLLMGGDLNVYPRPDDIALNASDQLGSLYDPALGLTNLWEVLLGQAPEAAYSYVYLGMAQTLDQIFANQTMLNDLQQIRIAHINSDFAADYPGDVARGTSDHDPNVATFVINDAPSVSAGGPYTVNEGSAVSLSATGSDPEGQPLTYAWDLDNNGTFETPGQNVSFEGMDGPADLTVSVQATDNGGLTATAQATVHVNNVAPEATFAAPAAVDEGSSFTLSLNNPVDVAADLGGLQYAFNCGSGYGDFSPANSVSCSTADNETLSVGGKVMDKDGGVTEYTATVTVKNVAPAATLTAPAAVDEGSTFTLSLTNPVDVAADLGSLQYAFNCGSGYGAFGTASMATCATVDDASLSVGGKVMDKDGGVTEYTAIVIVKNVAPIVSTPVTLLEPSFEGMIVIATASFSDPAFALDKPFTCTVDYGDGKGAAAGKVIGSVCFGLPHVYKTFGTYTVTVRVTDADGGTGTKSANHKVIFAWMGFFDPVNNLPALNSIKAGNAIQVKFSLGGNKGLGIFTAGSPSSIKINCTTGVSLGDEKSLGSTGLMYQGGLYQFNWKTEKAWAGTCRQLKVTLTDGTTHVANFKFK